MRGSRHGASTIGQSREGQQTGFLGSCWKAAEGDSQGPARPALFYLSYGAVQQSRPWTFRPYGLSRNCRTVRDHERSGRAETLVMLYQGLVVATPPRYGSCKYCQITCPHPRGLDCRVPFVLSSTTLLIAAKLAKFISGRLALLEASLLPSAIGSNTVWRTVRDSHGRPGRGANQVSRPSFGACGWAPSRTRLPASGMTALPR